MDTFSSFDLNNALPGYFVGLNNVIQSSFCEEDGLQEIMWTEADFFKCV